MKNYWAEFHTKLLVPQVSESNHVKESTLYTHDGSNAYRIIIYDSKTETVTVCGRCFSMTDVSSDFHPCTKKYLISN